MRYVHHITHKSRSPKTDPEGEGIKKVWELLAQQHVITLQNTALATNIALGVFYWTSQYLSLNWYYGHQRGVEGGKVKVKCTLVQALRLCTSHTAHRRSRGIALPFFDHNTGRGWGVSVTPRPLFTPGKDLVPIVQEAVWAPGLVWTGAEYLAPTGIRFPGGRW